MKNSPLDFKIIVAPKAAPGPDQIRGHGRKGLGILISAPDDTQECLKLLENILAAIRYQLDEDAYLFILPESDQMQTGPVSRKRQISHWLLFGIPPEHASLHFPLPPNIPVQHGGKVYLLAPSLETLNEERLQGGKTHRAALWAALQAIFPKP